MKKSFVLLIIIFSLHLSIQAQNSFGVIGGINHSKLKISDKAPGVEIESVSGYTFGLIIGFDISESYSITIQPRQIIKGEDVKLSQPNIWDWAKNRFNYIEIPIYFQTNLNYTNFKPFIFSGLNIAYLFSATSKIKRLVDISSPFYTPSESEIIEITLTDDYNKVDIAFDLGVGIEYLFNSKYSFSLDVRYSHGILNLSDESTVKFRGFQGLLGFLYQI